MPAQKLPPRLENPIDNILVAMADKLCPLLYRLDITPNTITVWSAISIMIAVYYLIDDNITAFGCLFALSYWLDCLDGHYARTYGLTTVFGDYLDHITDLVGLVAIVSVVIIKYKEHITFPIIFLFICIIYLMAVMFGCQERYSNHQSNSGSIGWLKKLCPADDSSHSLEKSLRWIRFFGAGSFNITVFLIVCYFHWRNKYST
jgi:phosphatidylglycerophosphate synthase